MDPSSRCASTGFFLPWSGFSSVVRLAVRAFWLGFPGRIVLTVIGRGFFAFYFQKPAFHFVCRFSPLGGSKVQAAVMPPAPGGYDRGFEAQEAVTPSAPGFIGRSQYLESALLGFV